MPKKPFRSHQKTQLNLTQHVSLKLFFRLYLLINPRLLV